MKNIFTLSLHFFLLLSFVYGQSLEFSGGISHNTFFDTNRNFDQTPHEAAYQGGLGYAIRAGSSFDFPASSDQVSLSFKFSLGFSTYNASYFLPYKDNSLKNAPRVDIQKSTIDLSIYPINILLKEKFQISFGGEFNFKVGGAMKDLTPLWLSVRCPNGGACENTLNLIHRNTSIRANTQFSYFIPLSENLALVPQYQFSVGLTEEFSGIFVNTKTLRHIFGIGIRKEL